ncbi:bi-domain-containing oxidoreductase [Dyadobacter sp. CY261]|uniref:bi-domain-containing oxidoreductase n=1 Tax=Dyadobacter sp. CY261 TaxID=2907203 RepID=UPI001F187852|nr:bi-domain-containing oxidoreductase [Dyadobacter sp. CY261]MCF0072439.1 bi-domain-containing oxidoreductase [Dyadobacter sp. CY261]
MKQLVQNLRSGETLLLEVPVPLARKGCLLIKSHKSLVSTGTERMLIEFSRANFLLKARQQPQRLRLVLDKIKTDGLWKTTRTVLRRLDQLMPLGYCNVGEIVAIGEGVEGFVIGDRVISNGPHAEMVCVPVNLVAKIPASVPDDEAAFTVLGAVGLHGVRLLVPALGEKVAVIGLGLIGLMAIDLLRAQGCEVIGVEPDKGRRGIARQKGIPVIHPQNGDDRLFLDRFGAVDGVIISAYTRSNDVISMASAICRKRAKIVLIGDVPLYLSRADFYQKELTFQVSCSYGPGRYDHNYEENGSDYPLPYVRWTENRNFQEILRLLATGALNVKNLVTDVIPLTDCERIYEGMNTSLGILIDYDVKCEIDATIVANSSNPPSHQKIVVAIIGAGNFVRMTLLPCLQGKYIKYISSSSGLTASELASKHGIPYATSNYHVVLEDDDVNLVIIATRHDSHAKIAAEALRAGKHVFVEKPLSIDANGVVAVKSALHEAERPVSITVGFNRRHAPQVVKMRELLGDAPMNVVITVNAGHIPGHAWVHDSARGGGRLIGEACHFIDLIAWITRSKVAEVCTNALRADDRMSSGNATVMLRLANGSTGVVHYFSNGHTSYPKERIEVHSLGRTLVLDDFKVLKGYGFPGFDRLKSSAGKGHQEQFGALFECIANQYSPLMPPEAIWNSSQATLAARDSLWTGGWIKVS